jgi:hypothetical protein
MQARRHVRTFVRQDFDTHAMPDDARHAFDDARHELGFEPVRLLPIQR